MIGNGLKSLGKSYTFNMYFVLLLLLWQCSKINSFYEASSQECLIGSVSPLKTGCPSAKRLLKSLTPQTLNVNNALFVRFIVIRQNWDTWLKKWFNSQGMILFIKYGKIFMQWLLYLIKKKIVNYLFVFTTLWKKRKWKGLCTSLLHRNLCCKKEEKLAVVDEWNIVMWFQLPAACDGWM